MLQSTLPRRLKAVRGSTRQVSAYGTLLLGGMCLGVSPVVVKAVGLPADISAFFRVALAAPVFLAWAMAVRRSGAEPQAGRAPARLYAMAALFFAADLATMHCAIRTTTVAVATLFTNCAPFFVGLIGLLGLTERPGAPFWKALPIALVGTGLLIGVSGFTGAGTVLGDGVALLAGSLYAGYLVAVKALRMRGASPTRIMVVVTFGSAVLLSPLFVAGGLPVPTSARTWALLLVLVVVGQVAGQGLVTVALRQLPVASSALVLLIQPVVAALLSWAFLGEALSPAQVGGMGLVLLSIYLALSPAPAPNRPREASSPQRRASAGLGRPLYEDTH